MAWREQIRGEASFRGVKFKTVDADLKVGRRNVLHEYPQRDLPYVEDLGRRARQYTIEAYVLGEDYLADRDALIEALEAPGAGELVHPRWGRLTVALQDYVSVKESQREGGIARFSITFVEAGENVFPAATDSTVSNLESAANAVDGAAEFDFGQVFSVEGPSFLSGCSMDAFTNDLDALVQSARRATDISALAQLVGDAAGLTGSLASLIRTPTVLVQGLRSLYAQFGTAVRRPLSAFAEMRDTFSRNSRSTATAIAGSTAARSLKNEGARADLQRRLAISNQARFLAIGLAQGGAGQAVRPSDAAGVATRDQAIALRDALVAQIDIELEQNDPTAAVATALGNLRSAVVRDVAARSEYLSRRSIYRPKAVLPALVLAHRVYQDATRADELVARNAVRHPAFVPVRDLEVLQ